jgi:hypothetical protein
VSLAWLRELAQTLPGLADAYRPGGPLDARLREQAMLAASEGHGDASCARAHGAWRDFLGERDAGAASDAVVAYARACADAHSPVERSELEVALSHDEVRVVRAVVALTSTIAAVRRTPPGPMLTAPLTISMAGVAAVLATVNRLAPPVPDIEAPADDDANLLTHLVAEAARVWLANAAVRLAVLRLPVPVVVGVRAGRAAATVRVGRGRVRVANGVAPDAVVVVEGEIEPLLRLASGRIVRQLGGVRVRPT